jgi:two-component system OmpR family sensor kinase
MAFAKRWWPELAWGLFSLANLLCMVLIDDWETVPFHFVWVSLTVLYGFRVWGNRVTGWILLATCVATGAALSYVVIPGPQGVDELTEIPLMAAMFLVMIWHACRRQAAIEALHAASRRERDFVRRASHELRTPITIARGYAEILAEEEEDPLRRQEAHRLLDELDRLSSLAQRLLMLAAAEDPDSFLRYEPTDFGRLVGDVTQRWFTTSPRSWALQVEPAGTVDVDRERLTSALDAVIENAVNATDDGGSIAIRGWAEPGVAVIAVEDSGVGIPAGATDHLLEPFTRFPRDAARRGTGLGLPIVRAIVEGHGGDVRIRSRPGSTVVEMRIPRSDRRTRIVRALERLETETPDPAPA